MGFNLVLSDAEIPVAVQTDIPSADRHEIKASLGLSFVLFSGIAAILAGPLLSGSSWLLFVQDDLLYYLKVAQNLAQGNGSTFNGMVATNGYQPLWFLVLTVLSRATRNPTAILTFLALTDFFAALLTFLLARRLVESTGVRPLVVFAFAAWTTLYSLTLFFYGMETTLTVPLMLGVICLLRDVAWLTRSARHTFVFGLLLSGMVLSRIDTLIFGGLLLAGILLFPSLRCLVRPRLVLGLLLGLLPIAIYFGINHLLFQTWLPVSGMAKELKFGRAPSLEPWRVFFHPLAGAFTLLLLGGMGIFHRIRRRLSPIDRVVFLSTLSFPFIYYFILSCVSDWTLWGWYMYPLRAAVCVSFVLLCSWPPLSRILALPWVTGALVLTVVCGVGLMRWTRQQADIQAASVEIAAFAQAHHGTYAMGDRAGRVAYLLDDPVVQTEGLMMDKDYLRFVRQQTPLRDVLAHYGVHYYIATAYKPFTGCFEANEPAKAGPASAHMRAEFCGPPVATFLHEGTRTLIYDLGQR